MGGMLHLISFESFEDKNVFMECKWLLNWFLELGNVNEMSASLWRETWIHIYGVPLIAEATTLSTRLDASMGRSC